MRVYKKLIYITALTASATLVIAVLLNYLSIFNKPDFWINVCLGVFGSAILTTMTSIVFYQYERRNTLEGFMYHTRQILFLLNKYQDTMSLGQKLNFFIDYQEFDKSEWDRDFGNIDFLFDKSKKKQYIHDCIYYPILKFNRAVENRAWNFRQCLGATQKNNAAMQQLVAELEDHLFETSTKDIPTKYDANGVPIEFCHCTAVMPKLVHNSYQELNGRYYEIIYGKRIARKQEDSSNG